MSNPWEGDCEEEQPRSPLSLTLEELMGEDHYPHITLNPQWGFDLTVENDSNQEMEATEIPPSAMECIADFCRQFLSFYDKRINNEKI